MTSSQSQADMNKRSSLHPYVVLIRERFPPAEYLPLLIVFVLANGLAFTGSLAVGPWWRWVGAGFVALSFFLRLRFFDEIKDYQTDLEVNPSRPLARGAISLSQVKTGIFWLLLFEILLALGMGWSVLLVHGMAIGFSLLMYNEFFLSDFLRPKLTTYAVTHTFSSCLIAFSVVTIITDLAPAELNGAQLIFLLMNWLFFNLFEFARKTFAPEEERPLVPSYSKLFSPLGAVFLSWSQAIGGVGLTWFTLREFSPKAGDSLMWLGIFLTIYLVLSLAFVFRPRAGQARFFRTLSGVYLLSHYGLLVLLL